eukprot:SAG22_NODE_363_length_11694_cov_40.815783_17_plen_123_part_00
MRRPAQLGERLEPWKDLVEQLVKQMIGDVRSFDGHDYVLDRATAKIGYKEQDGISYTKSYGFKTMFAYFKEFDAAEISRSARDSKIGFTIDCGTFSYAEIPKQYDCIMGVTGTLRGMSDAER